MFKEIILKLIINPHKDETKFEDIFKILKTYKNKLKRILIW